VHFDRVGSEETSSSSNVSDFAAQEIIEQEELIGSDTEEAEEDDPPARAREGLPTRFRMRHSRHYVDEVLGDGPIRTVREIPVAEIELPTDDPADVEGLAGSIRRLGVIEPLLVGRGDTHYRVIAGMRRLRAARQLGLGTVPCLVHDVDDEKLKVLREAATERPAVPPPPSEPVALDVPPPASALQAVADAAQGLEFVSALLPAMNAAGSDRLRWTVLTDLAGVELSQAKMAGAANEMLARTAPIEPTLVDSGSLVHDVVATIATEARLRSVRIETVALNTDCGVSLDASLCRNALTGIMQCLLALAPRAGTVLSVHAQVTSVRPALIVQCSLRDVDAELSPEALARFFDPAWREHPCGPTGALILGAAAKTARAHKGRVDVQARVPRGCAVTFVVPRPLADV
jgi:hypothetical protein